MKRENNPYLTALDTIHHKVFRSGISLKNCDEVIDFLSNDLILIGNLFGLNKYEAFALSVYLNISFYDKPKRDFISYLNTGKGFFYEFYKEIIVLQKYGFIRSNNGKMIQNDIMIHDFEISDDAINCILKQKKAKKKKIPKSITKNHISKVIVKLKNEIFQKVNNDDDWKPVFEKIKKIIIANRNIKCCQNLFNFDYVEESDLIFITYAVVKYSEKQQKLSIRELVDEIIVDKVLADTYYYSIKTGNPAFIKLNFIEIDTNSDKEQMMAEFTMKGYNHFLKDTIECSKPKCYRYDLLITKMPDTIKPCTLFFNDGFQHNVNNLFNLLTEENYVKTIENLKESNLPEGVTILFEGSPGTGKTELAYQLALHTGRMILSIDVSMLLDSYFGETEKNFRTVFESYKTALTDISLTPILLLNEADSIISKRTSVRNFADKSLNSTLNILLEELENFKGILIATTNLKINMDTAFERRFLFKYEFPKPDFLCMQKILKSNFEIFSDSFIEELADKFKITGGLIRNIKTRISIISTMSPNHRA